jgi:hypothetical protein
MLDILAASHRRRSPTATSPAAELLEQVGKSTSDFRFHAAAIASATKHFGEVAGVKLIRLLWTARI